MLPGSIIALSWLAEPHGHPRLAGLVWLGRMIAPANTRALFFAGAVLHFGIGDTKDGLLPDRMPRWLGIVGVSRTSA